MELNIAWLGFGNVGRALAKLVLDKQETLNHDYGIQFRAVGICTGSHGWVIDASGLDLQDALNTVSTGQRLDGLPSDSPAADTERFLSECPADLIFESIPTNPRDGQPALAYDYSLLERGIHVVTANKGPVAFGYRELKALAARKGIGFFFESTVMDGAPVLGIGREGLPAVTIRCVRGIFNSTTNYILTRMEQEGLTFEAALQMAQEIGIAETDPSLDIDGWDASIKTVILANVLMGADLRPAEVERTGIGGITLEDVQATDKEGYRIRLMCEAKREPDGGVTARVKPERVPFGSTLAGITGTTSIVDFETDVLPRLTLIEHEPGPSTTAYGMLADMINITRGRHIVGKL